MICNDSSHISKLKQTQIIKPEFLRSTVRKCENLNPMQGQCDAIIRLACAAFLPTHRVVISTFGGFSFSPLPSHSCPPSGGLGSSIELNWTDRNWCSTMRYSTRGFHLNVACLSRSASPVSRVSWNWSFSCPVWLKGGTNFVKALQVSRQETRTREVPWHDLHQKWWGSLTGVL